MKYLLHIGYMRVILQSDLGLATILKALSTARVVERDRRCEGHGFELTGEVCPVTAEALPGYAFVKRSTVLEPEVLPPIRTTLPRLHVHRAIADADRRAIERAGVKLIEGGR